MWYSSENVINLSGKVLLDTRRGDIIASLQVVTMEPILIISTHDTHARTKCNISGILYGSQANSIHRASQQSYRIALE